MVRALTAIFSTSICTLALAAPAMAQAGRTDMAAQQDADQPARSDGSGDIIVTANKRPERQLEVANAVSSFRASDLLSKGYTSLKDYLTLTPGVQFNQSLGSGAPVIRGLNLGVNSGTIVGLVVDGAPIGTASSFTFGGGDSIDLDPIDLKQVEVMKGPQGTLYGANTLGGLVSYTLAEPSLTRTSAIVRGELSGTENGETNYSIRGATSTPLVRDVLGLRVSGYVDRPGGFIDNAVTGASDQNRQKNWGVSGTLLFQPDPALTIKLSGIYQRVDRMIRDVVIYGADHEPATGDLHYDQYLSPYYRKHVGIGIASVDYDLGFAKLSAVGTYQKLFSYGFLNDTSGTLAKTFPQLEFFGGPTVPSPAFVSSDATQDTRRYTGEVRLTSNGNTPLQYLVGAYYSDERTRGPQITNVFDGTGAPAAGLAPALALNLTDTYREIAGFANLTYKFSERFDVTGGFRIGQIRQMSRQQFAGGELDAFNALFGFLGIPQTPADTGPIRDEKTVKNYLATARYHFSSDAMIYARFATGFRPGGANLQILGLPPTFKPDSTQNYEAGVKSKFLGGLGTVDLGAYYMRWNDILIAVGSGGISGYANGGRARIYGAEGSLTIRPVEGLNLAASLSYNKGNITKVDPIATGSEGLHDPLPNSAKWSGALSADYRTPASGDWAAIFGATAKFVGARHAYLLSSQVTPDYRMPGYTLIDAHVGMSSANLDIDLFVRNLTDKRAQLSAITNDGLNEVTVQRPRTIGVTVTGRY